MPAPLQPTLAGFWLFIRNVMRIDADKLPDDSTYPGWAFNISKMIVLRALMVVPSPDPAYPNLYALAVYNLAGDRLVNFAPDVQDAPIVEGSDPPLPYFAWLRSKLGLNSFVPGVIQSSSDNGTSQSLVVPKAMENLTFFDLQTLKTPWGQTYMGYAQSYGSTIWGISG